MYGYGAPVGFALAPVPMLAPVPVEVMNMVTEVVLVVEVVVVVSSSMVSVTLSGLSGMSVILSPSSVLVN